MILYLYAIYNIYVQTYVNVWSFLGNLSWYHGKMKYVRIKKNEIKYYVQCLC